MNESHSHKTHGPARRRSHAGSTSTSFSTSSTGPLRLAELAKQSCLGVHVENWREDMSPVRQYLPMQHIIGSLKRDRDEQVTFLKHEEDISWRLPSVRHHSDVSRDAVSPCSEDSFPDMLQTRKRRRTSESTYSSHSVATPASDPDRRFSYHAAEHIPQDIPSAALPGLNHILNLTSITTDERDIFSGYAPKHLEDPQVLMNEVLQLRDQMISEERKGIKDWFYEEEEQRAPLSPIIPPDRDAEVRKAFESFVNLDGPNPSFVTT